MPTFVHNRRMLIAAALAGVALLAYARTVAGDFEFLNVDDNDYVTHNPHVREGISAENLWWALTECHYAYNWHPLTWMSLQLDASLWDMHPRGFHFTNIVLHAANTALLFWLLERMTKALWPSAAAAALFALHPTHVESVAWVTERKDTLSTLFWLLTTLAYVWYAERPRMRRYVVMLILFALGLAAKPMLVTLPATLLLLDYWPLRRWPGGTASIGRLLLEKLPLFALVAASLPLTLAAQTVAIRTFDQLPMSVRVENAVVSYAQYIGMLFWPSDLAVFYPHPRNTIPGWKVAVAAAVLLAISAIALALARRRPYLIVGWLWYLGTMVPVIGLMQVGMHALADRYTYVPYVGLSLMLCWGLADLAPHWAGSARPIAAASIIALAACFALTWRQVGFWRDSVSLWKRTLAVTHDNALAHDYLANDLVRRGEFAEAEGHQREALRAMPQAAFMHGNLGVILQGLGRPDEAAAEFEAALRVDPNAQDAHLNHINLGRIRESQGRLTQARAHFAQALRLDPNSPTSHFNMGHILYRLGQPDAALKEFDKALALRDDFAEAHNHRGVVLEELGQTREAVKAYSEAARLNPEDYVVRCNLAYALQQIGNADAAAAQFRAATRLKPDWHDIVMETAWVLATNPDPAKRDGKEALRAARLVCQATNFRQPRALDVLAAACAERDLFDDATKYERQAIDILTSAKATDGLREARERLALYEKRQKYREPGGAP